MIKPKILTTLAIVCCFFMASFIYSPVWADDGGASGGQNIVGTGQGCASQNGPWQDTCYGATWVYYKVKKIDPDKPNSPIDMHGPIAHFTSTLTSKSPNKDCANTDGFYHLALERYKYNGSLASPYLNSSSEGIQVGTSQVGQNKKCKSDSDCSSSFSQHIGFKYWDLKKPNQAYKRYSKDKNIVATPHHYVSWTEAKAAFATLKKYDKAHPGEELAKGYYWGGKLGSFCYAPNSSIEAESKVEIVGKKSATAISKTGSKTKKIYYDTARPGETIKINFNHKFVDYENLDTDVAWTVSATKKPSGSLINNQPNPSQGIFKKQNGTLSTTSISFQIPATATESDSYRACQTLEYKEPRNKQTVKLKVCANISLKTTTVNDTGCKIPWAAAPSSSEDGGTVASYSAAKNLSKEERWSQQTYAKPGDSIRFHHCLFPGTQAARITGAGETGATSVAWPGIPAPDNGRTTIPNILFNNKYSISGWTEPSTPSHPDYFFGKSASSGSIVAGSSKEITTFSPSSRNTDYSCKFNPENVLIASAISGGYQIPGFKTKPTTCGALDSSDVGKTIKQQQNFSGVSAISVTGAQTTYSIQDSQSCPHEIPIGCGPNGPPCTGTSNFCGDGSSDNNHASLKYSVSSFSNAPVSSLASVIIPYNYDTTVETSIPSDPTVYGGENTPVEYTVNVEPRKNPDVDQEDPYATTTPSNTRVELIGFMVKPSLQAQSGLLPAAIQGTNSSPRDPCSYYRFRFGTNLTSEGCHVVESFTGPLNEKGKLDGDVFERSPSVTIPDLEPGTKFCTAVGVFPSDSHNRPGQDLGAGANTSANNTGSNWNISHASCRTIAKKPNFQVWGAGFFNAGTLSTSTSHKTISIGGQTYKRLFGSWSEQETISQGEVSGFASGAALGYNKTGSQMSTFAPYNVYATLPGGLENFTHSACQLAPLTIANHECRSNSIGSADIKGVSPRDDVVSRMLMRYTLPDSKSLDKYPKAEHCPILYKPNGQEADQSCVQLSSNVKYLRSEEPYAVIKRPVNPGRDHPETLVIHMSKGTLQVDADIKYAHINPDGSQNQTHYDISSLSQALLIAKDINIGSNNSNIDAWLIALGSSTSPKSSGIINTCYNFRPGDNLPQGQSASDTGDCATPLTVNGPIFSGKLLLYRTGGAGVGAHSIDPAERFDLRPDTYLWAYAQAQRFSQAISTFSRELAPRY